MRHASWVVATSAKRGKDPTVLEQASPSPHPGAESWQSLSSSFAYLPSRLGATSEKLGRGRGDPYVILDYAWDDKQE